MKFVLCALAVVGCALVGRALAGRSNRRARAIQEMMDALVQLRIRMLERLMPVGPALRQSRCEVFRLTGERISGAGVFQAWTSASAEMAKHAKPLDSLKGEDFSVLNRLFSGMGAGGKSEQDALFQAALRDLGRLEDEARKGGAERDRLYTTLGALSGLAIVVAFL